MIEFTTYRNVRAVVVDTGKAKMTLLPDNGGRIVSLKDDDGLEWMAFEGKGDTYRGITLDSSYCGADVCGMDDMFPTIDPEEAPVESGCRAGILYNDHGEISRVAYDRCYEENGSAVMEYTSGRLHYHYRKTVTPEADGSISLQYAITNQSDEDFPFLWAGHCMLATEYGSRLVLSYPDDAPAEIMFDGNLTYGPRGACFPVGPDALLSHGNESKDATYKFYYADPMPEGRIEFVRGFKSVVITFDEKKLPYVGVWMNNGGFKGFPCVAPEMCTVAYDKVSSAAMRGQHSVIPPRGTFSFSLRFSIRKQKD